MLTYANQLTILRMIFIPCFVLLLVYGFPRGALLVFILAGLTDLLDGYLARRLRQRTVLGSFLDPMADKLLITAAFITLTVPSVPVRVHLPIWLTITAFSRDFLIALASLIIHLRTHHTEFPPTFLGKCTTTSQLVAVAETLLVNVFPALEPLFWPLVVVALIFTVASGLHYFYRSARLIEAYEKAEVSHGGKGNPNHQH